MKITKSTLKKLISENLKKSKDFKKLNEKFYPKSVRKLGKDDDKRGGSVSHEFEGEIEPTMMSELDPAVYPFADPSHEDHASMKKRFSDDPSAFSDYRQDARIKSMFYGKKGKKTHRPKIEPSDLENVHGLRLPDDDLRAANRELSSQSRSELSPYDEGGESFSDDISTARGPSKQRRKSNAMMTLENTQISIQEKIVELESEGGQQERIEYLQGLYTDLQEVIDTLSSINI
jgi:hypothetical protein